LFRGDSSAEKTSTASKLPITAVTLDGLVAAVRVADHDWQSFLDDSIEAALDLGIQSRDVARASDEDFRHCLLLVLVRVSAYTSRARP
jgi:hypothetical protein